MAFERPTLKEIVDRITSDISTRVIGTVSALRRSTIRAFGAAYGGAVHLLYGFLDFMSKQYFEDTATVEYLNRKASIWGLARNPATFAHGSIVFTGTNGTILPAGTTLQRSDGVQFTVDADGLVASGTTTVTATCSTAGATGNMNAAGTLTIATPISGITSQGVIDSNGMAGGTDTESDDDFRARLLLLIQFPARGGNATDYEFWAKEISGVTRVWVHENQYGVGTVGVTFVRDNDSGSIIPSAGEVADVQTFIDSVRPLTAAVTVWAPVAQNLNFTIHIVPDTAAIRAAVTAELTDLIKRKAEPNVAGSGIIYLSQIREAVSAAAGEENNTVSVPTADSTPAVGSIYLMGTITWV